MTEPVTIESWYKHPQRIMSWVHRRSGVPHLKQRHISSQRSRSLALLIFGAVRIVAWTILAVLIALGLAHVHGFAWARDLAESLPFVVMISIYANWATDLDAATAAFAALVAADGHAASEKNRQLLAQDFTSLQSDINRLASLQGDEATALAAEICRRVRDGQ